MVDVVQAPEGKGGIERTIRKRQIFTNGPDEIRLRCETGKLLRKRRPSGTSPGEAWIGYEIFRGRRQIMPDDSSASAEVEHAAPKGGQDRGERLIVLAETVDGLGRRRHQIFVPPFHFLQSITPENIFPAREGLGHQIVSALSLLLRKLAGT